MSTLVDLGFAVCRVTIPAEEDEATLELFEPATQESAADSFVVPTLAAIFLIVQAIESERTDAEARRRLKEMRQDS